MQVSARRVDLTWDQQVFQEVEAPKDFADIAQDCFSPLFELDGGLRVTRLAHVVRRHLLSDSPGRVLANYFVRKELRTPNGPLNRPEGFEFHAHKKYRPKTLPEINSWIRWRTGTLTNGDTPVVAVSQDLNTPADRDSSYSAKETGNFLRNAHAEADEILKLYLRFPIAD
jgi:hypothetical protein